MKIILASDSPRRREILASLGVDFEVISPRINENTGINDPEKLTAELALLKGAAVFGKLEREKKSAVVISSDTVVFCGGEIFGKPRDAADARRMLSALSGRDHTVYSSVALTDINGTSCRVCVTGVYFDKIPDAEAERYLCTAEPYDKAGAYAIQGHAARWVSRIEGDYFGVVGLSVNLLCTLFSERYGVYL